MKQHCKNWEQGHINKRASRTVGINKVFYVFFFRGSVGINTTKPAKGCKREIWSTAVGGSTDLIYWFVYSRPWFKTITKYYNKGIRKKQPKNQI